MKPPKTRKPPLTRKAISRMLAVASLAQADADMMDTPQERERQREINEGCEYIQRIAGWWADHHGGKWPSLPEKRNREILR